MAQLKQQRRFRRQTDALCLVLVALFLGLSSVAWGAADPDPLPLQLEVQLNGFPLNVIGAFALLPDGKIGSPRSELTELGIATGDGAPEDIVPLNSIAGLSYVYDEEAQSIEIEVQGASRIAKDVSAKSDAEYIEATSSNGLMLNYSAYGAATYNIEDEILGLNGGSLSLDARAFSRFGTLQQTGVVGTTTFADMTALRLDTVYSYADQKRALSYRLGDIVSGGLNWTRPVRLGGVQIQRNFEIRPDLITMPLPQVEGTAAVPSSLDVYIDGVKAYSNKIQEGPFRVDNVPVYTNEGTVRVVLTDSTGREVETESEFITSPDLLKRDLYDFSVDAGVLRRDYGTQSFGYEDELVAIGSVRYGIADILTGEAHAEGGMGLIEGGFGFLLNGGHAGLFSGAVAASSFEDEQGLYVQAGWEADYGNIGLHASASRTFGEFFDLAAVSALSASKISASGVPRALDQLSITYSIPEMKAGFGASFIHREASDGKRSLLLSGSYQQSFMKDITVFANAFMDFGDEEEFGAFVGLSMPLGTTMTGTAGANMLHNGIEATAEVSRPFDDGETPYAWRIAHSEGDTRLTSASGAVRLRNASVEGNIAKQDDAMRANVAVDGSLVMAGGGIMAGRKIYDSFAVVDAGAEGVSVEYENRFAGKTGKNGKLLLPQLNSFQRNKIAIDVEDLPLAAGVDETEFVVVPREMSGVVVNFGVNAEQKAALVILTDAAGKYIPESSDVVLNGGEEPFLTGYDGQVYLTGVGAKNSVTVKYGGNQCSASFDYDPKDESQTTIGPIECS